MNNRRLFHLRRRTLQTAKSALLANSLIIFPGGLKDNKHNVVISQDDAFEVGDPRLNSIDWLVEGISASI